MNSPSRSIAAAIEQQRIAKRAIARHVARSADAASDRPRSLVPVTAGGDISTNIAVVHRVAGEAAAMADRPHTHSAELHLSADGLTSVASPFRV